jgi:Asp-tRNA(Asn)/Glu-tRNA(Gln) amidotransferase A subunit family amidase
MSEPWKLGVAAAARAIAAGELTPSDLVDALVARIEGLDQQIQAWARISRERKADKGALHGVPVGIKDIIATAGLEMNVGSPLLAGNIPTEDAPVIRRLRAAGAIVLGKTHMTEFAAMDPAPTRNPWNLGHTPGGSSSGSAAAVAACMVPGALGTQTAGSILRPAAYCGIVGLKPTYGAVDRTGVFPCAWSMDHVGPMARSVEDVELLYRVMAGVMSSPPGKDGLRIGVADRYFDERVDADTRRAFDSVVQNVKAAGAQIITVKLPKSFEAGVDAGIVTMYSEMAAVHRERNAAHRERYGWKLNCLLEAGRQVSAADYLRAQQVRRVFKAELSRTLEGIDCLLTPTTPSPAPKGLDATGDWTHNLPFSSSGHPSLTVPVALSGAGLPIGVQLAARHGGEALLFRAGALVERLVNFSYEARWH